MNQCCICKKELKDCETFGPRNFPVCMKDKREYEEKLIEINAMGKRFEQDIAFSELVGLRDKPKERREIEELEKQISDWEDEIDDLNDEIHNYEFMCNQARRKIRELKARMGTPVKAKATSPQTTP